MQMSLNESINDMLDDLICDFPGYREEAKFLKKEYQYRLPRKVIGNVCPTCNSSLLDNEKYCGQCGQKLER